MDTIFINSRNSKASKRLLLKPSDKVNLKMNDKCCYQILTCTIHGNIKENHTKPTNLKHQLQRGMNSLYYLMDHIQHGIFHFILGIF